MSLQSEISTAHRDSKKVVTGSMSRDEIMQEFGVSRVTAWRATKSGYICLNYHIPAVSMQPVCVKEKELVVRVAEKKADISFDMWPHLEHIKIIAKGFWLRYLKGYGVDFQDYWDVVFDTLLSATCTNPDTFMWVGKLCKNMAFREIRKLKDLEKFRSFQFEGASFDINDVEIEDPEKILNWCRDQIIETHGLKAWAKVWRWANDRRQYHCPKEIRNYFLQS